MCTHFKKEKNPYFTAEFFFKVQFHMPLILHLESAFLDLTLSNKKAIKNMNIRLYYDIKNMNIRLYQQKSIKFLKSRSFLLPYCLIFPLYIFESLFVWLCVHVCVPLKWHQKNPSRPNLIWSRAKVSKIPLFRRSFCLLKGKARFFIKIISIFVISDPKNPTRPNLERPSDNKTKPVYWLE